MAQRRNIILGACGGVAQALARRLVEAGQQPVLLARDAERLEALASELGCPSRVVDALDGAQVQDACDWVHAELGGVEGLANLVGSLHLKPAHLTSVDQWEHVLHTNLSSAFHCVRALGRLAQKADGPTSLVLVSSAAAQVGLANHEAIAAAKAGVEGLARSAAATYAPKGLRVNVVAPGLTKTPMTRRLYASSVAEEASKAMHPLGELGEPEQVASAVAWLLDPAQRWVTGQVLGVDGGLATVRPRPGAKPRAKVTS